MNHQHRFLRYIMDLLDKLCEEQTSVPIIHQPTVFRPKDTIMTSVPGIYLLISTKVPQFLYIGETSSLTKRLQIHNSGGGPAATANFGLHPFTMFAYVVGFQHKGERQRFESLWKVTARQQQELSSTNNRFILIGQDLVQKYN
jgi:predicted GIY-YIG superfamily endonuclease